MIRITFLKEDFNNNKKIIDKYYKIGYNKHAVEKMVDVAQLVRAPGCGPGGRGFESHLSPH